MKKFTRTVKTTSVRLNTIEVVDGAVTVMDDFCITLDGDVTAEDAVRLAKKEVESLKNKTLLCTGVEVMEKKYEMDIYTFMEHAKVV